MNELLATEIKPRWTQDRRGWNRTWEKLLGVLYPENKKFFDTLLGAYNERPWVKDVAACRVHGANDQRTQLIEMQQALREYMLYHPNFSGGWLRLSRARQEEIILEGLVRTCEATPDMESRRLFVPESRLAILTERGGRGLLDIISQIEGAPPQEPYLVPHRVFDPVGSTKQQSAEGQLFVLTKMFSRNVFLAILFNNVLLAFHGEKACFRLTKLNNYKNLLRDMKTSNPLQHHELKDVLKHSEWCCRSCGKVESALPQGQRLLSCAKCKAVGRVVKYCDRYCQKHEWATHKVACGKPDIVSAEEALRQISPTTIPGVETAGDADDNPSAFPTPAMPPAIRSRHLKYQIQLLRDQPKYSYIYTRSSDARAQVGLAVDEGPSKVAFLALRDQAFESGDMETVVELYRWLAVGVYGDRGRLKELRVQLSLEYGVDENVFAQTDVSLSSRSPM